MTWEADYEEGKMTEFTNGLWGLGKYKTLDDAIRYIKEEYIPMRLLEKDNSD